MFLNALRLFRVLGNIVAQYQLYNGPLCALLNRFIITDAYSELRKSSASDCSYRCTDFSSDSPEFFLKPRVRWYRIKNLENCNSIFQGQSLHGTRWTRPARLTVWVTWDPMWLMSMDRGLNLASTSFKTELFVSATLLYFFPTNIHCCCYCH